MLKFPAFVFPEDENSLFFFYKDIITPPGGYNLDYNF